LQNVEFDYFQNYVMGCVADVPSRLSIRHVLVYYIDMFCLVMCCTGLHRPAAAAKPLLTAAHTDSSQYELLGEVM